MSYDRSWIPRQKIPDGYGFAEEYNEGVKYFTWNLHEAILRNRMIQIFLLDVLTIHVEINYTNSI